jgi:hypothetical protein
MAWKPQSEIVKRGVANNEIAADTGVASIQDEETDIEESQI